MIIRFIKWVIGICNHEWEFVGENKDAWGLKRVYECKRCKIIRVDYV